VMEMSHRGKEFIGIAAGAEANIRKLLNISSNYKVLFMQGGAIGENAIVPMNLLRGKTAIDFVNTGEWSKKSIGEAKKYAKVNIVASSEDKNFTYMPKQTSWKLNPDAAYVHICSNETIGGVEYHWTPDTGAVPLVADMSSTILSRPVDVSKYGLIYAGAQKNMGPAGLTVVIVRDDLIGQALPITPSAFDYKIVADNDSMYNTLPTFAVYVAGLVFEWLLQNGGLTAIEQKNIAKSALLYDFIDNSKLYKNTVAKEDRSRMNVVFTTRDEAMDNAFVKGAEARGLLQLKGHRSVGGIRASIYNAMPLAGVQALVHFMQEFEKTHA
jgi:phosphoserine aminotransferase